MSRGKRDRRRCRDPRGTVRDALARAFAAQVKRALEAARQAAECDVGINVIEASALHVKFTARIDDVSGIATVGTRTIEQDVVEIVHRLTRAWLARRGQARPSA